MAKKLKVGDVIRGYRVTKVFGPGMMAISYSAQAPDGRKVFFKQYKSPAPSVVWYEPFVNYQRELSSRVRNGKASHFAVAQVDAFEERWGGPCYFQAYEFVENGDDLQKILDEEREHHRRTKLAPTADPSVWARHITWAKVFMSGIVALHQSNIAHADLKPANVYLIKDPTITAGYQLKLIDMDFSLMTDRRAPWHGHQGYIGSDNYRSPEHLTRGHVPGLASDIFTSGLILYELLAGRHPYWSEDQGEYAKLVHAHAAKPPALAGLMPSPASNAEVSSALHRCLSPDPAARPSAAELRTILSGRATPAAASAARPGKTATAAVVPAVRGPASASAGQPIVANALELQEAGGRSLSIRVRTELTKSLMQQLGPDAEFWDAKQCVVERNADNQWVLSPLGETTNETLLNGKAVTKPVLLRQGDSIAVGRQAKGIVKMPLSVRGR
jgi:eukaryotic-like serine/threonine-protein kinase